MIEELFGSPARAKLLKLFLMSPESKFSSVDACRQAKLRPAQFLAEARRLLKLGVLKSHAMRVIIEPPTAGGKLASPKSVRTVMFFANKEFPLFDELRRLMLKSAPHAKGQIVSRIRRLGAVKLAILAGVFIDNPTSRADLLIVGDSIRKSKMKSFIEWLEAEIGKELSYVAMSSTEFKYRIEMYDRFVRDILEFPHETVINKIGI